MHNTGFHFTVINLVQNVLYKIDDQESIYCLDHKLFPAFTSQTRSQAKHFKVASAILPFCLMKTADAAAFANGAAHLVASIPHWGCEIKSFSQYIGILGFGQEQF